MATLQTISLGLESKQPNRAEYIYFYSFMVFSQLSPSFCKKNICFSPFSLLFVPHYKQSINSSISRASDAAGDVSTYLCLTLVWNVVKMDEPFHHKHKKSIMTGLQDWGWSERSASNRGVITAGGHNVACTWQSVRPDSPSTLIQSG